MDLTSDIRLRLDRAEKRIVEIERVEATMVHDAVVFPSPDDRTFVWRVFAHPLPEDLPLTAADAVHDLRAAMDYAVYEVGAGDSLPEPDAKALKWPMCDKPRDFRSSMAKMPTVPAPAQQVLEGHQPYNDRGGRPPLVLLSKLDNITKHRKLRVMTSAVGSVVVPVDPARVTATANMGPIGPKGKEVLRLAFKEPQPQLLPDPAGTWRVQLVFGDLLHSDGTAVEVLRRSQAAVVRAIEQLLAA